MSGTAGLAFDPTGAMLAVGGEGGAVSLAATREGRTRWTVRATNAGAARELVFSPDATRVAVGFGAGVIHLLDTATGDALLELHPAPPEVCAVRFAPNGSSLIAVSSGTPGGITVFETGSRAEHGEARAIQARARALVDGLRGRLHFAEEIARAVATGEPGEVRDAATSLALARGDHPNYLNGDAWAVVRFPNRSAEEYALALAQSEHACRIRPEDHAFWNTLGVAQIRTGRLDEAIATLTRCTKMPRPDGVPPHPLDLLALAIAQARKGNRVEASATLEQARASLSGGRYARIPSTTGSCPRRAA